ncbi:MAG: DHH family phosphoesterase, partial [Candidatus Roizmanbacteria bacterium]
MSFSITRTITENLPPDKIVQYLLEDRGISVADFMHPPHPKALVFSDFFEDKKQFEKNMKKTIKLLKKIKEKQGMIIVYCDYDADGITGGAVLWQTLHHLGFSVMPYIPDRKTEGYGFSKLGIDTIVEKYDPSLIISVDHGIVGHESITYAKEKNIPIIVTDHHQKASTDPEDAFAIFHTATQSGGDYYP